MNNDLISRTELKKYAIPCQIHNGALTDLCVPLYQIDNAPTVDVKPRGEWTQSETDRIYYTNNWKCSNCNSVYAIWNSPQVHNYNFCPNCGADMRKGGDVT